MTQAILVDELLRKDLEAQKIFTFLWISFKHNEIQLSVFVWFRYIVNLSYNLFSQFIYCYNKYLFYFIFDYIDSQKKPSNI